MKKKACLWRSPTWHLLCLIPPHPQLSPSLSPCSHPDQVQEWEKKKEYEDKTREEEEVKKREVQQTLSHFLVPKKGPSTFVALGQPTNTFSPTPPKKKREKIAPRDKSGGQLHSLQLSGIIPGDSCFFLSWGTKVFGRAGRIWPLSVDAICWKPEEEGALILLPFFIDSLA